MWDYRREIERAFRLHQTRGCSYGSGEDRDYKIRQELARIIKPNHRNRGIARPLTHREWVAIYNAAEWGHSFQDWKARNIGLHPFAQMGDRSIDTFCRVFPDVKTWDLSTLAALAYAHFENLGEKRWYGEVYPIFGFPPTKGLCAQSSMSWMNGKMCITWRVWREGFLRNQHLIFVPPSENGTPCRALNRFLMGGDYIPIRGCFYGLRDHLTIKIDGELCSMTRLGSRKQTRSKPCPL